MRVVTKEIRWHDTRPIFSCDLQPCKLEAKKGKQLHPYERPEGQQAVVAPTEWRLATAGGDHHVRVWRVTPTPEVISSEPGSNSGGKEGSVPKVEYMATLSRHTAVVNVIRFSPTGNTLASAGDDGNLLLWGLIDGAPQSTSSANFEDTANEAQFATEVWKIRKSIRVTQQEIYDLAWSPDGEWIIVGSTDNTARIFSATEGNCVAQITDHNNYVQGVAWDPLNKFFATQSSDRHMHVYGLDIRRHASGALEFHYNLVGKKSKMPVEDKKPLAAWPQSDSSSSTSNGFKRPNPRRSQSRASDSDVESKVSQTLHDASALSDTEMAPPLHRTSTASRRSSAASSAASPRPSMGGSASAARSARSPSPMPPLPAIRVPTAASSSPQARDTALPNDKQSTKLNVQGSANGESSAKDNRAQQLYGNQDISPFFRRLAWSTEGSLLLTPAGLFEDPFVVSKEVSSQATSAKQKGAKLEKSSKDKGPKPTVYIYARSNLTNHPVAHLPGHKSGSIAIAFNPVLFELRSVGQHTKPVHLDITAGQDASVSLSPEGDKNGLPADETTGHPLKGAFDLPYRMIYAIATHESVYVYDTQQSGPICMFGNMHYAPFTDLTWSLDGQTLVISSQDGYCSLVVFEGSDLGEPVEDARQHQRPLAPMFTDVSTASTGKIASNPSNSITPAVRPLESSSAGTSASEIDLTASNRPPTNTNTVNTAEGEPKPKKRRVALTTVAPPEAEIPKGPI